MLIRHSAMRLAHTAMRHGVWYADGMTPEEIRTIRAATGLSQARFALRYHLSTRTVQDWEQGARSPGAAGEALLTAIQRDARTMARLLNDDDNADTATAIAVGESLV